MRDEATRLKRRHRVLRKVELKPSPAGTLLCTSNAGEEKKGREREREEGREGKGREFIPVKMALTGDAKLRLLDISMLLSLSHVVEVADVSNLMTVTMN